MKFLEPMIIAFSMYSKIPMPRIEVEQGKY